MNEGIMNNITVIIITWNQREELKCCVKTLMENNPGVQVIVADNGSQDGTDVWLSEQAVDYVYFDEGVQSWGTVLNTVFSKFSLEEKIVLLSPECEPGRYMLTALGETLDSKEEVGVVGACGNELPYEQNLVVSNLEELWELEKQRQGAADYRVIGCAGYCFAMKRDLIIQLGAFDERLAYLDVMIDYQLRAIKAGYGNYLSRAACYLYHEIKNELRKNLYETLCYADRQQLRQIWDTNYFMLSANHKFLAMIHREKQEGFSVLEVGCDMGANLLGIKNEYPNSRIFGLEINENSAAIGKNAANVFWGNIEEECVPFEEKFDYIIFGDVLEHLHAPEKTIRYCRSLLKEGGRIIASIPNVMHITVMQQLLRGEFRYTDIGLLDKTHIHLFTGKEIVRMFQQENYEVESLEGLIYELTEEERQLEEKLLKICAEDMMPQAFEVYQYSVIARKIEDIYE